MSFLKRKPKFGTYIRRPHTTASGYKATQVSAAYNLPVGDGTGITVGVIELGGGYNASDLATMGLNATNVSVVGVAGGSSVSDGPDGADGEVMLDVEVIAQVAPGAKIRVYFCPNADPGFLAGITQATAECNIISISWGGPESSWSPAAVKPFSAAFAAARAKGIPVFAASGDSGSTDGTRTNQTDYPASDPNVIGCGGTRLTLNASGSRLAEIAWDDSPTRAASGGGVSTLFPGRQVPDVSGNADSVTGYLCEVDGQSGIIGGTSAVAPLYAAMTAVLMQLLKKAPFDFLDTVTNNPTACFDVTQGSNGGFRAGLGRDDVTGIGVVDFGKLYALLSGRATTPVPTPTPTPTPTGDAKFEVWLRQAITYCDQWLRSKGR